jgi:DNA-binding response OmpR family regulator
MTSQNILLVHRQESLVNLCAAWLQSEGYRVRGTIEQAEALEFVEQEAFDLALIEHAPPQADGLDLLASLKEKIDLAAIIFSEQSMLPVQTVAEALNLGILDVIKKPSRPEGFLKTVGQALAQHRPGQVQGNLRDLGLPSLISILCNEGRQVSLDIWHNGNQATVFFERGEITHAALGPLEGEEALYEALSWGEGRFVMNVGDAAPQNTISTSWTGLVLEGLRRVDEAEFDQELLEPADLVDADIDQDETLTWSDELDLGMPEPDFAPASAAAQPAPAFDLEEGVETQMEDRLDQLYKALKPRCILLTNGSGRLLHLQGDIERSRALSLAALVAGSFSATSEIAEIVAQSGESHKFRQSLQEGQDFSLYSAEAGPSWVLAITFEPGETNLGLVRQFTLQAAADLAELSSRTRDVSEQQHEMGDAMDDLFRQQVGDALEDLFA